MTRPTSKASPETKAEKPAETKAVALSPIDRIAAMAKEAKASEAKGGGQFISTRGGQFTVGGSATKSLDVVVLDWVLENALYVGNYNPDAPAIPVCYAFSRSENGEAGLAPHADSKSPQCAQCAGCPANEFGSAATGKGKACKNMRSLLVLLRTDVAEGPDAIAKAEAFTLKVPPASLKNWSGYVGSLADTAGLHPISAVTQLGSEPSARGGFQLTFAYVDEDKELFSDEVLEALLARREKLTDEQLMVPYKEPDVPAAPAAGGKKFQAKGVSPAGNGYQAKF